MADYEKGNPIFDYDDDEFNCLIFEFSGDATGKTDLDYYRYIVDNAVCSYEVTIKKYGIEGRTNGFYKEVADPMMNRLELSDKISSLLKDTQYTLLAIGGKSRQNEDESI